MKHASFLIGFALVAGAVAQTLLHDETFSELTNVASNSVAYFYIPSSEFSQTSGTQTVEVVVLRQTPFGDTTSAVGVCHTTGSSCSTSSYTAETTDFSFDAVVGVDYTIGVSFFAPEESLSSINFYVKWCTGYCWSTCVSECYGRGTCNITTEECTCDSYVTDGNSTTYCHTDDDDGAYDGFARTILLIIFLAVILPIVIFALIVIAIIACVCGITCCGVAMGNASSKHRYPASVQAAPPVAMVATGYPPQQQPPMTTVTVAAYPPAGYPPPQQQAVAGYPPQAGYPQSAYPTQQQQAGYPQPAYPTQQQQAGYPAPGAGYPTQQQQGGFPEPQFAATQRAYPATTQQPSEVAPPS